MARRERAIYDPGWVGRYVHRGRVDSEEAKDKTVTILDGEDYVLYYSIENGHPVAWWKKDEIGFVRCKE